MKHVYPKDGRLYLRIKVRGKWRGVATDFRPGQERAAAALLAQLQLKLAAGKDITGDTGPVTVAKWSAVWLREREATISTWKNDEGVMRLHVLPTLGGMRLDEVRPLHLVELVKGWRTKMAPKTVYNAYSTVSALFRDACLRDLLPMHMSPCILTKHQLGPKVDRDPEWRPTAIYSRDELERLISDERVPMDRRVWYALEGIGGLRHSETSKMPWRNCGVQPETPPLGMMWILGKGGINRPVPIHPTLAAILAEWRLFGWGEFMGRKPMPDDLVVPLPPDHVRRPGGVRSKENARDRLAIDLAVLGMRHRRGHDLRRTMISLSRSDGAIKDIHKRATHKPPKEVIEGYTTYEWDVLCREVSKLKVHRRQTGKVVSLPKASLVAGAGVATHDATTETQTMIHTANYPVAPPGLEPGGNASNHDSLSLSKTLHHKTTHSYKTGQAFEGDEQALTASIERSSVAAALFVASKHWDESGDAARLREELTWILAKLDGAK
jgi:integrase